MDKRTIKSEVKFGVPLNAEQKEAKALVMDNKVSVLRGKAGSGKTLLASQIALDMLLRGMVGKIIISRPTVSTEDIGYLPGTLEEKLDPYLQSIYENMETLYPKDKIKKCITEGLIEIIPFAFLRGRNFVNCVAVIDEGQNITNTQMKLLLGRICNGSKIIICGDTDQIDLKDPKQSGLDFICREMKEIPGFQIIDLQTNHRDPIVEEILKVYEKNGK